MIGRTRPKKKKAVLPDPKRAKRRLAAALLLLFLFLVLPFGILLNRVHLQLEQETFFHYRQQAEELALRIDKVIADLLRPEELRKFGDYQFFSVGETPLLQQQEVTFSPLSQFPPQSTIPGILGYFQVGPDGRLHSPVFPDVDDATAEQLHDEFGFSSEEVLQRLSLRRRLEEILNRNGLLRTTTIEDSVFAEKTKSANKIPPTGQQLSTLKMNTAYWERDNLQFPPSKAKGKAQGRRFSKKAPLRMQRTETINLPAQRGQTVQQSADDPGPQQANLAEQLFNVIVPNVTSSDYGRSTASSTQEQVSRRDMDIQPLPQSGNAALISPENRSIDILTFEGAIDPLQFTVLKDQEFAFFRKVWRDKQRFIQGFLTTGDIFVRETIEKLFQMDALSDVSKLIAGYRGSVIYSSPAPQSYTGQKSDEQASKEPILLYRASLAAPLNDIELLFTTDRLPSDGGSALIKVISLVFIAVLTFGLYFIYRLGVGHIQLAQRRSDFVSAVSHELKTPLTSIRMYGEMLREGWIDDDEKRKSYYDFIFFESERLSRLIANILQLSKLSKGNTGIEPRRFSPDHLLDLIQSKISSQVEAGGFVLELSKDQKSEAEDVEIMADADAFSQIIINLVDNALKFSPSADEKKIVVGYHLSERNKQSVIAFFVRDFGPGIAEDQMRKIFQLFYRAESEMTRTTPGTGIGLALVRELCRAMDAEVSVSNRTPGAEFQILFPVV